MEYVISRVVGNGQFPGRGEALTDANGPYRPVVERYATQYVHTIREPGPGEPGRAISLVAGEDIAAINADIRCRVVPGSTLDDTLTALQAQVVNNWLSNNGFDPVAVAGMTKRELVIAVARQLDPTFSPSAFSVGGNRMEPPA